MDTSLPVYTEWQDTVEDAEEKSHNNEWMGGGQSGGVKPTSYTTHVHKTWIIKHPRKNNGVSSTRGAKTMPTQNSEQHVWNAMKVMKHLVCQGFKDHHMLS